jgi:hypothetical protein
MVMQYFWFIWCLFASVSEPTLSMHVLSKIKATKIRAARYGARSCFYTLNELSQGQRISVEPILENINNKLHLDPDLGASWSACQVTALSSMLDIKSQDQALIARYLLDVAPDGSPIDVDDFHRRAQDLGLKTFHLSKTKVRKYLQCLQQDLRSDIGEKIDIKLIKNDHEEWCIADKQAAFFKVIKLLQQHRVRLGVVIYLGTPTLTEVRSLTGAKYLVPYRYDSNRYVLDTTGNFMQIAGDGCTRIDDDGSLLIEGRVSIVGSTTASHYKKALLSGVNEEGLPIRCHIPKLTIPEGEGLFLLHVGFPLIHEYRLHHELGNIVSKLELDRFDPLDFMAERFNLLHDLYPTRPEDIKWASMSLFHFSYAPHFAEHRYEDCGIEIPNRIVARGVNTITPKNPRHHPLMIVTPYKAHDKNHIVSILKAELGIRVSMELSGGAIVHMVVERWQHDGFKPIVEPQEYQKRVMNFLKSLLVYFDVNFCPQTRSTLLFFGVDKSWILKNIKLYDKYGE